MDMHASFLRFFLPQRRVRTSRKLSWEHFETIKFEGHGTFGTPSKWIQIWPVELGLGDLATTQMWVPLNKIEAIELTPASDSSRNESAKYHIVISTSKAKFYACLEPLLLEDARSCVEILAAMVSRA
jgi:hypothetical protein